MPVEQTVDEGLASIAASGERMPRLQSLIVSQGGDVLLERYYNGHGPTDLTNIKSVSKSLISALVGIAIEQGHIPGGVDATIDDYFAPELGSSVDNAKASITIEDLLTMRAGLRSTSNGHYGAWVQSENWVKFALDQPLESAPGSTMQYSTADTHLLSAILTKATGRSTLEFAREALTEPLGFRLEPWPRDPQGVYVGGNDMELTSRQLLAFGELYLNGGRVGGRQIVPERWVQASLQPRAESPVGDERFYGYGWWICELAGHVAPHAWGYGGQFVVLVPDLSLVLVLTSASHHGSDRYEHANQAYGLLQRVIRRIDERLAIENQL